MVKVAPWPGDALHLDVALGLLDEAESLAEAEAGAFADFLGGEEGLEDRFQPVRHDAVTGVGHRDRDELAAAADLSAQRGNGADLADGDRQPAFAVHGVAGVDGQIDQRRLELGDIGNGKAAGGRDIDIDAYPGADEGTDQLRHALDLRADVEHLRLQRLPAGKGQ